METGERTNRLLAALPPEEHAQLAPHLHRVEMTSGTVLCEAGERAPFALFPLSGVVSSVVVLSGGATVEAWTTGIDGVVGSWLLCKNAPSPHRLIQQLAGASLRIDADIFSNLLSELPKLRDLVTRYSLTLLHQSGQNAACNARHTIEERMCRWLLTCSDRAGSDELDLTQEFLSVMLGVRRQSINLAAGTLQRAGLITYRRGGLKILNREGLAAAACECYAATTQMFERYMSLSCGNSGAESRVTMA